MVFNPDIPQPRDDLSVSQSDLLANFQGLNTQFSISHVAFNDTGGDSGKHKFVTFVQQAAVPETKADEYLIFSQDQAGTPELYARPESNGTAHQITKAGSIYTGLKPVVAVNFDYSGTILGTALNVSGANITKPDGAGKAAFLVTFDNAIGTNNYMWNLSGFDSSNNPVIGYAYPNATFSDSVNSAFIKFEFRNQNATSLTQMTGISLICWSIQ